ncbi:PAS domain-containing sensor histidine kinase [Romboutsia maritimum]|uniref:histidine kinase n=1 Tax=Romboutsia maritimum TaxID=2020948 RepID=A0A371IWF6_9FIRM|nr:PAS domain-containing sensor histidine kinase [Romboutsia maritimum]RDY24817.1 PAS domain-containing sensor histidine kinase [Romboutsia maritimum]
MYKYINLLTVAIFLMSVYVLHANCKVSKFKKSVISTLVISTIIILKTICILGDISNSNLLILNYIYKIMIISFVTQLNFKLKQIKHINILFNINYFLGIYCLLAPSDKHIYLYITIIISYMLMTSLYLFSISLYTKKFKPKYTIIQVLYFIYLFINLILKTGNEFIYIGESLDFVSSIYIFLKVSRTHIKDINFKEKDILSKLNRTNIFIKLCYEKLNYNKNTTKKIEESLKKKQTILELILNQSNRCILLIDNDGYILNEDDSFSKMWNEYSDCKYKINLKKFLNKSIKNKESFIENLEAVREYGVELSEEIEGKDGRFFECSYAPFNLGNERIGIICAITDITYKKKSKIQIKENNIKYKKIVDNIPHSILVANDSEIIYNNGKNQDIDFNKNDIKNIIIEKAANGELHYNCQNGMELCLNIDRVEFSEIGENKSLVVIRDITDYKKILRDIDYSKKKYEALVNIIPEGIYILNFENKLLTYANSTFLDILGSKDIEDVRLDNINEEVTITSGNTNGGIKFKRTTIKNKYGNDVDIESGGMLIDINKKLKMVGIVRDITEQLKMEAIEREIEIKERENKIKTEFFVNMSHELKTPLNVIYSSNQLLESVFRYKILKNPQDSLSETIQIVKKHLKISMGLIDSIMDLVKLESDFHYTDKDYYNIVNISEDLVTEFNRCICTKDRNIVFDTDEEEKIVNIDPNDFESVIFTFLSMTMRYSLPNSIIYFNLESKANKSIITISNENGFDYDKYISDNERKILDIRVTVAKLIIDLHGGNIKIEMKEEKYLEIIIIVDSYEKIRNYKNISINKNDNSIYDEYTKICSF